MGRVCPYKNKPWVNTIHNGIQRRQDRSVVDAHAKATGRGVGGGRVSSSAEVTTSMAECGSIGIVASFSFCKSPPVSASGAGCRLCCCEAFPITTRSGSDNDDCVVGFTDDVSGRW
jgi:hypothetical protein